MLRLRLCESVQAGKHRRHAHLCTDGRGKCCSYCDAEDQDGPWKAWRYESTGSISFGLVRDQRLVTGQSGREGN